MQEFDEKNFRNILLKVTTVQEFRDAEPELIELTTEGKLYNKEDIVYLAYDESEISEIANNKVVLKLKDDTVQMNRFGEFKTNMVFKKGKRDISMYGTPYGEFRVEILTDKVDINLGEDDGIVYVEYTVSVSGSPEVKHKLVASYDVVY